MSLKATFSTNYWNTIPKKCKNCFKAIYTIEGKNNKKVYYQCSMFGKFKKDCDLTVRERILPKPEKILESK